MSKLGKALDTVERRFKKFEDERLGRIGGWPGCAFITILTIMILILVITPNIGRTFLMSNDEIDQAYKEAWDERWRAVGKLWPGNWKK